jgi:hypothetical protein
MLTMFVFPDSLILLEKTSEKLLLSFYPNYVFPDPIAGLYIG